MITVYTGSLILLLVAMKRFHPHSWHSPRLFLLFFLLFCFCAFLYKPFFDPWAWTAFLFLFYLAYDDLLNRSFNVLLTIPLYLYGLWHAASLPLFLAGACVFLLFWGMSRKGWIGEGEAYLLPVFLFLLPAASLTSFLYVSALFGFYLFFLSFLLGYKEKEHPFVPTLVLGFFVVLTGHHSFPLVFWLSLGLIPFSLFFLFLRKKSE